MNPRILSQLVAVLAKNLLMLTAAMSIGYVGILIPTLTDSTSHEVVYIDEIETSWISSIVPITSMVGSILSGTITEPFGRKGSMMFLTIPSFIAWTSFYFVEQKWHIFAALALHGLTNGLIEAPILSYVAEVTEPHLRGALSATVLVSSSFGFFLEFLVGSLLHWKMVALVSSVIPLLALCLLTQIPETPYWLLARNRLDDARKSLAWLRGWTTITNIEEELQQIHKSFNMNISDGYSAKVTKTDGRICSSIVTKFSKKSFLWPFSLVSILFAWSNFVGIGTLQSYGALISVTLKAPLNKYHATVLVGSSQFLGSLTCILTVRYLGKRITALASSFGLCICTAGIGIYAYTEGALSLNFINVNSSQSQGGVSIYEWIPILILIFYAFITYCGPRSLPWILIGEVFSNETRAIGCGLATSIHYFSAFVANQWYIKMNTVLTFPGVYWTYAVISFIGFLIIYFAVPETEGKTLEEIVNYFNGQSKVANTIERSIPHE